MERIAIFAALRWECQPVLQHMSQVRRQQVGSFTVWQSAARASEIWLVKTGMGMEQADSAARAIAASGDFALFLSTGCAGALSPALAPGDLALATTMLNGAGETFQTDGAVRERASIAAASAAVRATLGPVLCSPQALSTVAAKRAAAERGAIAVEMEGGPIAACAARAGIPFASVRAILDAADTEIRHAGRFIDPQSGAIRSLALAGYVATHPSVVPELLAIQRMMKAAQNSLEKFFGAWFEK